MTTNKVTAVETQAVHVEPLTPTDRVSAVETQTVVVEPPAPNDKVVAIEAQAVYVSPGAIFWQLGQPLLSTGNLPFVDRFTDGSSLTLGDTGSYAVGAPGHTGTGLLRESNRLWQVVTHPTLTVAPSPTCTLSLWVQTRTGYSTTSLPGIAIGGEDGYQIVTDVRPTGHALEIRAGLSSSGASESSEAGTVTDVDSWYLVEVAWSDAGMQATLYADDNGQPGAALAIVFRAAADITIASGSVGVVTYGKSAVDTLTVTS